MGLLNMKEIVYICFCVCVCVFVCVKKVSLCVCSANIPGICNLIHACSLIVHLHADTYPVLVFKCSQLPLYKVIHVRGVDIIKSNKNKTSVESVQLGKSLD